MRLAPTDGRTRTNNKRIPPLLPSKPQKPPVGRRKRNARQYDDEACPSARHVRQHRIARRSTPQHCAAHTASHTTPQHRDTLRYSCAILRYSALFCAMPRYDALCRAIRHDMMRYATLCFTTMRYATPCSKMPCQTPSAPAGSRTHAHTDILSPFPPYQRDFLHYNPPPLPPTPDGSIRISI